MTRKDKQEQRDAKRTDRQVDEAVLRHGPGLKALAEAVARNKGKDGKR